MRCSRRMSWRRWRTARTWQAHVRGVRAGRHFDHGRLGLRPAGGHRPTRAAAARFPQTHVAWHRLAPALAQRSTVIVADLPGYGQSTLSTRAQGPASKRRVAGALAAAMQACGFERWTVVGHDRGGRVAYRMALDTPARVERLAVLDVVPTLDMVERCSHELARAMPNWFFLAQPAPLPERVVLEAGDVYINGILDGWLGPMGSLDPSARDAYLSAFRNPNVVHAACEDYRAGSGVDVEHDRADRDSGRQLSCPVLVLWSADGLTGRFFDPVRTWLQWARTVQGRAIRAGHFLMEEAPDEVAAALVPFLSGAR